MTRKIGILAKAKSGTARKTPAKKPKKSRKPAAAKKPARRRKKSAENPPHAIGHPPPGEGKRGERGYLAYLLRQAQAATRLRMERALADLGVTPPQFIVLTMLKSYPGLSGADVARVALLTPQTVGVIIANLERQGAGAAAGRRPWRQDADHCPALALQDRPGTSVKREERLFFLWFCELHHTT
jgi:hypothetical protein